MSKAKIAGKSSSGGISLSFIAGSIVAWCTNPTFVGWAGIGKSLLVGLGTSIASGLGGLAGFLGGGLVGAAIGGLIFRSRKAALVGGLALGIPGAVGGSVAGAVAGYKTVEGWLLEKDKANAKVSFNENAGKPAVAGSKAFVLDAQALARYSR